MTPELERRRVARERPFDGETVALSGIDLELLREVLAFACARLGSSHPRIFLSHDWHEHDRLLTPARPLAWEDLLRSVSSVSALYSGRDDDWGVCLAVHPESFEWLLRFNVDEDDPDDPRTATGDLDFSCTPDGENAGLVAELQARWPTGCERQPAHAYFERRRPG